MDGSLPAMTLDEGSFEDDDANTHDRSPLLAPTHQNQRAYRNALGCFGTGVTLITTQGSQGPVGMTVNSFASVSLEPALVLWSLAKSSGRFSPFADAEYFCIHVLEQRQKDIALAFAQDGSAFNSCDWKVDSNGTPQIDETLTRFDCSLSATHDAGDHLIIVGAVEFFTVNDGKPLLFAQGSFGDFHMKR